MSDGEESNTQEPVYSEAPGFTDDEGNFHPESPAEYYRRLKEAAPNPQPIATYAPGQEVPGGMTQSEIQAMVQRSEIHLAQPEAGIVAPKAPEFTEEQLISVHKLTQPELDTTAKMHNQAVADLSTEMQGFKARWSGLISNNKFTGTEVEYQRYRAEAANINQKAADINQKAQLISNEIQRRYEEYITYGTGIETQKSDITQADPDKLKEALLNASTYGERRDIAKQFDITDNDYRATLDEFNKLDYRAREAYDPLHVFSINTPENQKTTLTLYKAYKQANLTPYQQESYQIGKQAVGFVPVAGTVVNWNDMSPAWRTVSIVSDALFILPFTKIPQTAMQFGKSLGKLGTSELAIEGKLLSRNMSKAINLVEDGAKAERATLKSVSTPEVVEAYDAWRGALRNYANNLTEIREGNKVVSELSTPSEKLVKALEHAKSVTGKLETEATQAGNNLVTVQAKALAKNPNMSKAGLDTTKIEEFGNESVRQVRQLINRIYDGDIPSIKDSTEAIKRLSAIEQPTLEQLADLSKAKQNLAIARSGELQKLSLQRAKLIDTMRTNREPEQILKTAKEVNRLENEIGKSLDGFETEWAKSGSRWSEDMPRISGKTITTPGRFGSKPRSYIGGGARTTTTGTELLPGIAGLKVIATGDWGTEYSIPGVKVIDVPGKETVHVEPQPYWAGEVTTVEPITTPKTSPSPIPRRPYEPEKTPEPLEPGTIIPHVPSTPSPMYPPEEEPTITTPFEPVIPETKPVTRPPFEPEPGKITWTPGVVISPKIHAASESIIIRVNSQATPQEQAEAVRQATEAYKTAMKNSLSTSEAIKLINATVPNTKVNPIDTTFPAIETLTFPEIMEEVVPIEEVVPTQKIKTPIPPEIPVKKSPAPIPPVKYKPNKKPLEQAAIITGTQPPVTLKYGLYWWTFYPPYKTKRDIKVTIDPPAGATVVDSTGSAYKTIQAIGGNADVVFTADFGIMDMTVNKPTKKPGKKGAIHFHKDAKQKTSHTLSAKGVKLR